MLSMLSSLGVSGCTGAMLSDAVRLERRGEYKEGIDQVMLTVDGKKLAVIAPTYHYILDVQPEFSDLLRSPLHRKLSARFSTFDIHPGGIASGTVWLTLNDPDDQEYAKALSLGFKGPKTEASKRYKISGERYLARDFKLPANLTPLNESYEITVVEWSRGAKQAKILLTPLTVAADGVILLAAIPLGLLWYFSGAKMSLM